MTSTSEKQAAREMVLAELRVNVKRTGAIAQSWPDGHGATYRREIARLWRLALLAVEQGAAKGTKVRERRISS